MAGDSSLALFGSFGHGNVGDEAVPLAIEDILTRAGKACNLAVVARWDSVPDKNVIGLGADYDDQLKALNGKPVVLSGGGIIQPNDMGCIARFANYREKVSPSKSSLIACSFEFGVDYSWRMKRRLRRLFGEMEHIYTRDYLSELFFRDVFPEFDVATTGDVVLAMQATSSPYAQSIGSDYIAVSLSKIWEDSPDWLNWISSELRVLSDSLDKPILFVPMSCAQADNDRAVHDKVMSALKEHTLKNEPVSIAEPLGPREIAAVFRDAALVVSMRLHGCVMSYGQRTPFVALSYHPKLIGFSQTVGWRQFLLPKNIGVRQEGGRYGVSFKSEQFAKGDLVATAMDALTYGSFDLLPLFNRTLSSAFLSAQG